MPPLPSGWAPRLDAPPYRLSGVIYGSLLNSRAALAALGPAVEQPPHKAPPRSVVLYLKPPNTFVERGRPVRVDAEAPELELAAQLGIVIGRTACAVGAADALDHVAGYLVVADFSVPHEAHYRPQVRYKARDASCVLGPGVTARQRVPDPDALGLRVVVDGRVVQEGSTGDRIRGTARLIADVSEFMTLSPGDILLTGALPGAPRVRDGARIRIEIDALEPLQTHVAAAGGRGAGS